MSLLEMIDVSTRMFRKGPAVVTREVNGLNVTDAYMMPPESEAPEHLKMIDVHFMKVGVDMVVAEPLKEAIELHLGKNSGLWVKGPSYIEIGFHVGDQGEALRLMALGEALGFWKVITPATLGITDQAQADKAAGVGYVMVTGWMPEAKGGAGEAD